MSKSAASEHEELNASDKMKHEFDKVKRDCNLMSKLTDMKSKIDLLQQELNYELEQLELVKKQSTTDHSRLPPYPTYPTSNFLPQNSYTNYPTVPYWFPNANSYDNNPYMLGYDNRVQTHAAFYDSLDKVDQMCSNEIRNTTQDICNLKKIKRDWMHCQPYNNLGSPAGDDLKELQGINLTRVDALTDKSYGFQFEGPDRRGNDATKVYGKSDLCLDPEESLNETASLGTSSAQSPNVKRVRRAPNHPLPPVAHHHHLTD